MAETTTKIGPIFRGANGGLSDDLFTGIQNSFYYSDKIEIREDAKSIYASSVPSYSTLTQDNISGSPVASVKDKLVSEDREYIIFTNTYSTSIVYGLDINGVLTLLKTFNNVNIKDAEIFGGYIYFSSIDMFGYLKLYRIAQSSSASEWEALSDDPFYQLQIGDIYRLPLYATDTQLCIGAGNKILKILLVTPDTVLTGLTIQNGYSIKTLNELGGYIRAVANVGDNYDEIILWDKVSKAPTEVIPFEGYKFLASCIYGGYQYLLSTDGIGIVNGYQYYILKKMELGNYSSAYPENMCVYDDKIYFTANKGIYIYGAKNKNYNDVLSLRYYDASSKYIAQTSDGLIVGKSGRIGIGTKKNTTGEFVTMGYFGESLSEIKQALALKVGYNIPQLGNIHIYYRTEADATSYNEREWEWHEITNSTTGITASSNTRSPFSTTLKLNCRFQRIQFKFVLTSDITSQALVLKTNLYNADLFYNSILE